MAARQGEPGQWDHLKPRDDRKTEPLELDRIPLEPDDDLLRFLAEYAPLQEWERRVLEIVAEESDLERTGSPWVWIIDPLDGTTNFAHSYPMFCASVALTVDGESVAGAVFDPIRDELFTAEKGGGAHLNGRKLKVTPEDRLIQSLIITGFPYDLHEKLAERMRPFIRVAARARAVRRLRERFMHAMPRFLLPGHDRRAGWRAKR